MGHRLPPSKHYPCPTCGATIQYSGSKLCQSCYNSLRKKHGPMEADALIARELGEREVTALAVAKNERTCARPGCQNISAAKFCSFECERATFQQTRIFTPRAGKTSAFVDLAKLREELLEDIRAAVKTGSRGKAFAPRALAGGAMHLVAPVDLHMGKLAWAPETGEDYDLKIARDRFYTAIDILLSRAAGFPVSEHVFVVGNDLMQVDNLLSTTTAGTFQDTDSRYRKLFRESVEAMAGAAERMAEIAPVKIVIVPGNHDALASFHLGEVLAARFSAHRAITVDPAISPRLYHRFGRTLLGFTHGNEEKHADLPLIMATERPSDWAATTFHEWMIGHWHFKRETRYTAGDTMNGVSVRILPSLSGTDAWHAKKGYVGEHKRSESFLYDPVDGCVASFIATVSKEAA